MRLPSAPLWRVGRPWPWAPCNTTDRKTHSQTNGVAAATVFLIIAMCSFRRGWSRPPLEWDRGQSASEREHVEHRARLNLLQFRRGLDEPLVPGAAEADQDDEKLLAVCLERHRRGGGA